MVQMLLLCIYLYIYIYNVSIAVINKPATSISIDAW